MSPAVEKLPVHVGCAGLPEGMSRAKYFKTLRFLETDVLSEGTPRPAVVTRWRREAGPDATLSALASRRITHDAAAPGARRPAPALPVEAQARLGGFKDTDEVRAAWADTMEGARLLQAQVVLFQTPPSFSPSSRNREALARFFADVVGGERPVTLAWEPSGMWTPVEAAALCSELDLVLAFDPLRPDTDIPPVRRAYLRLHDLGLAGGRVTDDQLEVLAELADTLDESWIVFTGAHRHRDARRLARLLAL